MECTSLEKIIQHSLEAGTKIAQYGVDLLDSKISVIWSQLFIFLIGTARDLFWFCKPGYPAHISISKVPVTLIKLDFMRLYQADIWQEGAMNTATVAKLEEQHEWDKWLV